MSEDKLKKLLSLCADLLTEYERQRDEQRVTMIRLQHTVAECMRAFGIRAKPELVKTDEPIA